MGLDDVFASAANAAFTAFDDIATSITITTGSTATYDTDTGAVTNDSPTTDTVDAILVRYQEIDFQNPAIQKGDQKVLIEDADLSNLSAIAPEDSVTIGSETWQVIDVRKDPAGVIWILQIRRS